MQDEIAVTFTLSRDAIARARSAIYDEAHDLKLLSNKQGKRLQFLAFGSLERGTAEYLQEEYHEDSRACYAVSEVLYRALEEGS